MTSALEKLKKVEQGRTFALNKSDYVFQRVVHKNDKFVVYEIMSKAKPIYTISEGKHEEEWKHSAVVRVTKLPDNEDEIKALLDLHDVRTSINYEACKDMVTFYDQGFTQYGNALYYLTRYDDPGRTFDYFINVDHKGIQIEALDCYRLIRGVLGAFSYLEANGYVLTQFDDQNLYVGSFSEDRGCFFKIMFKGHKDNSLSSCNLVKHRFSPPESQSDSIYKSYSFSAGLMVLYAIFSTCKLIDVSLLVDLFQNLTKLKGLIQKAAGIIYPSERDVTEIRHYFENFMQDLLEIDISRRKSPTDLLKHKYITECGKLDYQEFLKEVEGNQKLNKKFQGQEEPNNYDA